MEDSLRVYILQPFDYLSKQEFSHILIELSSPPYISEKIATSTYFHDIHDMRFSIETFIQPDDIRMSGPLENIVFLSDLLERLFIAHHLLRYRFKSYKLSCESVYSQINFSKSSFANDFANLVVLRLCFIIVVLYILQYLVVYLCFCIIFFIQLYFTVICKSWRIGTRHVSSHMS